MGYLEDGTMVVVNGGAEFIGETIRAHVLSVKNLSKPGVISEHTRMIFCNAAEEGISLSEQDRECALSSMGGENDLNKNFLTL